MNRGVAGQDFMNFNELSVVSMVFLSLVCTGRNLFFCKFGGRIRSDFWKNPEFFNFEFVRSITLTNV